MSARYTRGRQGRPKRTKRAKAKAYNRRRKDTNPLIRWKRHRHCVKRLRERHGLIVTPSELARIEDDLGLEWDGETVITIQGQVVRVRYRDGTITTAI